MLLLRQVDDFAMATPNEELAKSIYDRIGKKLQLPSEKEVPFKCLGLLEDFNGLNVKQCRDCKSIKTVESNLRPCLFLCSLSNLFFIIKNSKSNIMRRIM